MAHVDPDLKEQHQPTPEEAAAIAAAGGGAAGKAAEGGKSPEQAQADQEAAMKAKAAEGNVAFTDEAATKIAETTIKMLQERGAFEQSTPPPPPPSNEGGDQGGSGEEGEQSGGTEGNQPPPPAAPETPPRKLTWAERFQGKS